MVIMRELKKEERVNQTFLYKNTMQVVSVVDARNWYQRTQLDGDTKLVAKVCGWYTSLIRTLVPTQQELVPSTIASLLRIPTELVVLAFEKDFLVGTAQASLLRPARRYEVVISNVVVESSRQCRGYGTTMLRQLEILAGNRWSPPGPFRLRAELPSPRAAQFFASLGYIVQADVLAHKMKW